LRLNSGIIPLRYGDLQILMLDIGYQTKVYSDIRYNVGLYALRADIGRSDIRLSPISLITDIGLSAHLWSKVVSIDISLFKPPNALLYVVFCMGISNDQC
jgi:hypothetical protein